MHSFWKLIGGSVAAVAGGSVAMGQDGWTPLTPSPDTRVVYVSVSGNDANSGLTAAAPKRTIAAAKALIRDRYPDWLLLHKGDTFQEGIYGWGRGGRSASEPQVIGTYGAGDRPTLVTSWSLNPTHQAHGFATWGGEPMDHVWIVGLHFRPSYYDGTHPAEIEEPAGIDIVRPGTDFLLEGCLIEGYGNNVIVQGVGGVRTDTRIRRNVLVDPVRLDPNNGSTNIYMGQYDGVLIEENVMANSPAHEAAGAMLSHNIYLGEGNTAHNAVRGNIAYNGGRTNFNQRSGGLIENNLSIRGAQGITVGVFYAPSYVPATIIDNVVIESRNNQSGQMLGFGLSLEKVWGVEIGRNLICNATDGRDHKAMTFQNTIAGVNIHDNVISRWGEAVRHGYDTVKFTGTPDGPVLFTRNRIMQPTDSYMVTLEGGSFPPANMVFGGNHYWSNRVENAWSGWFRTTEQNYTRGQWLSPEPSAVFLPSSFPDAGRTIGSYMVSLGMTGTTGAFMAEARRQSKDFWRPAFTAAAVNDYLRAGFGMSPACVADFNRDWRLNLLDFQAFFAAFTEGLPSADINSDSALNLLDFQDFQQSFTAGCDFPG
jgi:hypothetical protein